MDSGLRVALRLRPHPNLPVDGSLLAGITTRKDLRGVTSIVRTLGLDPACYDRLLDFFHSPALDLNRLTSAWCALVFRFHPAILRVNGMPVLAGDGIKLAKAGKKMLGSRNSISNPTPTSSQSTSSATPVQAIAVLTQALASVFALPLACRIHEGVVFSNRDQRTLLDKMILLFKVKNAGRTWRPKGKTEGGELQRFPELGAGQGASVWDL